MFGAILGDIAGSRFEFSRPQAFNYKKEPFFTDACCFTDDTVLTVATKYAVLNGCLLPERLPGVRPQIPPGWVRFHVQALA